MFLELNSTESPWEITTSTSTAIQSKQPATLNQNHDELGLREKVKNATVGFIFGVTMGTPAFGAALLGALGNNKLANALHYKCVEELGFRTNVMTEAVGSTLTEIGSLTAIALPFVGSFLATRKIESSNHVIQTALKTNYGVNGWILGFITGGAISRSLLNFS